MDYSFFSLNKFKKIDFSNQIFYCKFLHKMTNPLVVMDSIFDDSAVFPTFTGRYGNMIEKFLKEFPKATMSFYNSSEISDNDLVKRDEGSCQIIIHAQATMIDLNNNPSLFNCFMNFYLCSLTKKLYIICSDSTHLPHFLVFLKNVVIKMREMRINDFSITKTVPIFNTHSYNQVIADLEAWNSHTNYKGTIFSYYNIRPDFTKFVINEALSYDYPIEPDLSKLPVISTV